MITILSNSRPRSGRRRAVGWRDAGRKPARTEKMRQAFLFLSLLIGVALSNAQGSSLIYSTSSPQNNGLISSFEDIKLIFDISNVIATYGGAENDWGICCNAYYDEYEPEEDMTAVLYKGTPNEGNVLQRLENTIEPGKNGFNPGSIFTLPFKQMPIDEGQLYTVVVTYDMYACKVDETTWKRDTKYSFFSNPLTLTFYGASDAAKVLTAESNSIDLNTKYELLPQVILSFNYDINIIAGENIYLNENSNVVAAASEVQINPQDSKSILISFPNTTLYNGHKYTLHIPEGTVCIAGEPDVVNSAIDIEINGASYRSFGTGRVRPSNGSVTVMGEITVPFKFPEVEGKNYGFVAMTDESNFTGYIYKGNDFTAEPVETIVGEVTSDSKGLIFYPKTVFEPETDYTFVIPEGNVKAYEIGSMTQAYLKDYISERVELHYTTPAVSDLPLWTPAAMNLTDGDAMKYVDYFIIDCPDYEYDDIIYNTVSSKTLGDKGVLYEVTADGETEIATFPITRQTLTGESEIGNGQYIGRHFVGVVNQELYAGKTYKLVMKPNSFIVDNPFIGNHIGNQEVAVTVKGATRTEFDVTYTLAEVGSLKTVVGAGKTVTVNLGGTEDWKVAEVLFNGEAVETEGEAYTTPAIEDDATIEVAYEYAHEIDYDFTSGVAEITDCPFGISHEGDMLVISGVKEGDNISIYAVNGMKIAALSAVPAGNDVVSISLPTGQVYIILINDKSVKVRH